MKHASHPDIINRLRRAEGHLRAVVAMLEGGRSCLDIAQQLHAVEAAVAGAKREMIHDHIDHCLADGVEAGEQNAGALFKELKAISRYL